MKSVEELKRYYVDLTDKELIEEYKYRMNISTRMLSGESTELVMRTREAVKELMIERGLK